MGKNFKTSMENPASVKRHRMYRPAVMAGPVSAVKEMASIGSTGAKCKVI
jgi:hypothetical protein